MNSNKNFQKMYSEGYVDIQFIPVVFKKTDIFHETGLMTGADKLYKAVINVTSMLYFDSDLMNQALTRVVSVPFDPRRSKRKCTCSQRVHTVLYCFQ